MPENLLQLSNLGLMGALIVFCWRLPEIVRHVTDYLRGRAEARDGEIQRRESVRAAELDKLAETFRADREHILTTFKEELRYEREQSSRQFQELLAAVERRECGFSAHHAGNHHPPFPLLGRVPSSGETTTPGAAK